MSVFTVNDIMAYEDGQMDEDEMVSFFQGLINDGTAWKLQGSYARTAKALIDNGFCMHPGGDTVRCAPRDV